MTLELLNTELNDLDVLAADVINTSLNYDCRGHIWIVSGDYFG